ncbi:hypothetical protein EG328_008982 [Venturia inaequalis]|uniref:AA9 family lytic polysaccharide monooxygenase n=1 Tax=Venturia inaequalis TaxID=5025 RepID=A0A8H3UB86_VENIN|nr:hypothetical protein EG328_008982 [Venturia inaequalis]KAE9975588.1 hypothetical protein EG327_008413 [Venturia inaequalis]
MRGARLLAVAVGLLFHGAQSHYRFHQLVINDNKEDKHQYVRPSTNLNFPIITAVTAGGKVTWNADVKVYHQGPVAIYMTKVDNATAADGSTKWFKIKEIGPSFSSKGGDWKEAMQDDFEVQIPKCIPAGEYLMRIEQIAIHVPGIPPQFHVACAQLGVFGIGKELPPDSHLVKIPEVHSKGHEGFTVNIFQNFRSYRMPGPPVWSC